MKDQQARIAAAIAAYLEENTFLNDSDIYAPEITFGIVKEYPTPTHTECCKELADQIAAAIAPHLEAGAGWEDAPDWAEWRTVDKNGQVTFWEKQPHAHLLSKYWVDDAGGNRKYCEVDNWQYKIQKRPR